MTVASGPPGKSCFVSLPPCHLLLAGSALLHVRVWSSSAVGLPCVQYLQYRVPTYLGTCLGTL